MIIDPHAIEGSQFSCYCGAGLAYRFAKELIPNSSMLDPLLVFASIATVTDVMPLIGDNRNLVIKGLDLIRKRHVTLGLNELLNEFDLSYVTEETMDSVLARQSMPLEDCLMTGQKK